ncbi:MAG: helix-turn-helix domain-containing protein [Promethearchaeota archaeon]
MSFNQFRCSLLKYKIFEHIVLAHECTVNELADKFGINQKTYYRKAKRWDKMRLI